jgi:hypothetical protein
MALSYLLPDSKLRPDRSAYYRVKRRCQACGRTYFTDNYYGRQLYLEHVKGCVGVRPESVAGED